MKCRLIHNSFEYWEVGPDLCLPIRLVDQIECFENSQFAFVVLTNKQKAAIGDILVLESGQLRVYKYSAFINRYEVVEEVRQG